MKYKIEYQYIQPFQEVVKGDVLVDLTDEAVFQIQQKIDRAKEQSITEQMRKKLPKLYNKMMDAGYPFAQCVCCRSVRELDMVNDISWEKVDESLLLQEDIVKNGFVPCDGKGHPYINEELHRQWVLWENKRLALMEYDAQLAYYADRFHFAVEGVLDDAVLQFNLPEELFFRR